MAKGPPPIPRKVLTAKEAAQKIAKKAGEYQRQLQQAGAQTEAVRSGLYKGKRNSRARKIQRRLAYNAKHGLPPPLQPPPVDADTLVMGGHPIQMGSIAYTGKDLEER